MRDGVIPSLIYFIFFHTDALTGSSLPAVSTADNGKSIIVVDGKYSLMKLSSFKVTYSLKSNYSRYEGNGNAPTGTWLQGSESYNCSGYNAVTIKITEYSGHAYFSGRDLTFNYDSFSKPYGDNVTMTANTEYHLISMSTSQRGDGHQVYAVYDGEKLTFTVYAYKTNKISGAYYYLDKFTCNLEFFTNV